MNRLVAILLLQISVLGNLFAHSHCGSALPTQGQNRAHIHVGSSLHVKQHKHGAHEHSHHGHHDHRQGDSSNSAPLEPLDHDSDAVYLVAADLVFTTSERCTLEIESQFLEETFPCLVGIANHPSTFHTLALSNTSELPLYLLHAALRL